MSTTPLVAEAHPRLPQLALDSAYAQCREITRRHARTFYFSAQLLPARLRPDMLALYAFCRLTDDLVDRPGPGDPAAALAGWRRRSRLPAAEQSDPVLLAWATVRDRHGIPQHLAEELCDGVGQDLARRRYATYAELERYCYLVASTVGLMSMHVVGHHDERAPAHAIKLGIALQLTNILRDIGEDLHSGRIYLPTSELEQFGVAEADLQRGQVTPALRRLLGFQIARAHALYDEGLRGIAMLDPAGHFAISAAATLYRGILDQIVANDYDVFNHRAHVTTLGKVARLPRIWLRARQLRQRPT